MELLNRFQVRDCFNQQLAVFSVPSRNVGQFVNELDIMLDGSQVKVSQRWFWDVCQRLLGHRAYGSLAAKLYDCIDAFFYLSYA